MIIIMMIIIIIFIIIIIIVIIIIMASGEDLLAVLRPGPLLPHAKMLLVPIRFFFGRVDYVLEGSVAQSMSGQLRKCDFLFSLSAPSPLPLTRPISSSLREFQHGAFAWQRAPE